MPENEEGYSAYIEYITSNSETFSVFNGFVFTAITILLTLLPNPNEISSQTMLFFLAVLFNLIGFVLHGNERILAYCVKTAPEFPPEFKRGLYSRLGHSVYYVFIGTLVLMFLAWNLLYLTIATASVSIFFIIIDYVLFKPFAEYYREYGWAKRARIRKE